MNLFQNLSEKKSVEINLKEKLYLINSKKNYRFHIFFYSELSVFLFFINNKIKHGFFTNSLLIKKLKKDDLFLRYLYLT
jgi:hypothetical protein